MKIIQTQCKKQQQIKNISMFLRNPNIFQLSLIQNKTVKSMTEVKIHVTSHVMETKVSIACESQVLCCCCSFFCCSCYSKSECSYSQCLVPASFVLLVPVSNLFL